MAVAAAGMFAVGSVLQHEAASRSTSSGRLELRQLVAKPGWVVGQSATVLGTLLQVTALALAPVAIVQPLLAGALVIAMGIRSLRDHCLPARLEVLGAACTCAGLAGFLTAAHPARGTGGQLPSPGAVAVAVLLVVALVAGCSRLGRGPRGALACGASAGIAAGVAAVLISTALKSFSERGFLHTVTGPALWAALVSAIAAQWAAQQAYSRGSLSWSLPALTLLDPLAAVPAARLLIGERLEPGHAVVWAPAAAVAVLGVILLARTGEGCRRPLVFRRRQRAMR
ncbi:DMT family transporter [Amycolatopsis australiensis]|uniref:Magnesium transporter NIPA n=1 Tax=Amycolatopsis australiensis TaxID=546364 RepID=A0A1K1R676_9PSEU|nr:DMT family transporter [Amycolatopsis australiensis]SFW67509.1 hypothetical protein SAMN04489730_2735 [Amycolatopsis australiensis]